MESIGGLLVLLQEDPLREMALNRLHSVVDEHWAEILNSIEPILDLAENSEMAASIVSKTYFHLEEYGYALYYALLAGDLFDLSSQNEYEVTLVGKCISVFIYQENEDIFGNPETMKEVERVVTSLFDGCMKEGTVRAFKEAIGIAIETKDVSVVEKVLSKCNKIPELLTYLLNTAGKTIRNKEFRNKIYQLLHKIYLETPNSNQAEALRCAHATNDPKRYNEILLSITDMNIAYQAILDLIDSQDLIFQYHLISLVPKETMIYKILKRDIASVINFTYLRNNSKTDIILFRRLRSIFNSPRHHGNMLRTAALFCHALLQCNCRTHRWLSNKDGKDFMKKNSNWAQFFAVACYGVIGSHIKTLKSFLPASTESTGGVFVEGGALYAVGLSMKSHKARSYLYTVAKNARNTRRASQSDQFSYGKLEAVEHGALLGLGVSSISKVDTKLGMIEHNAFLNETAAEETGKMKLSDFLIEEIHEDNALVGEAAAYAIGLNALSTGKDEILTALFEVMASNTTHEKILRSTGMAIALTLQGQEEAADSWIEVLLSKSTPDVWDRYAAIYTLGLAYVGTGNSLILSKLFKYAVTDVNDDIRRAAVINIGFVCLNQPGQTVKLVAPLAQSFNPHIRYGATMAIAISGSGDEALKLLKVLRKDKIDFVRKGAMIASSILLAGKNWDLEEESKTLVAEMMRVIDSSKKPALARFGAYISFGILQAGGRNQRLSLVSSGGVIKHPAVAGMALFLQYWYWYPLLHMVSLCFSPMALIGVRIDENKVELVRNWSVKSDLDNKKMKFFDYPKRYKSKKSQKNKVSSSKSKNDKSMEVDEEEDPENSKYVTASRRMKMLCSPLRVTPAQERYIQIPTDGRFVPVTGRKTGISVLHDTQPDGPQDTFVIYTKEQPVEVLPTNPVIEQVTEEAATPTEPKPDELPDSFPAPQ